MGKFGLRIVIPLMLICGLNVVSAKAKESVPTAAEETKIKKDAERFIQSLGDEAIKVINAAEVIKSQEQRELQVRSKFRKLLKGNFALEDIARYSLGSFYKELSAEEKQNFLRCFENMLVKVYSSNFSAYKTAKLLVTGAKIKVTNRGKQQILVYSNIMVPNKAGVNVTWSIFPTEGGDLKVYDVVIDNVSISGSQRSEFMSQISKKGLKRFLADFRKKYGQNEEQKQ